MFLEVVTALLARRGIEVASRFGAILLGAREIDVIPCSEVFLDAFETFRRQRGVKLSFTDAAIVAVARRRQVERVATFDDDFRRVDGIVVMPE